MHTHAETRQAEAEAEAEAVTQAYPQTHGNRTHPPQTTHTTHTHVNSIRS